MNYIFLFFSKFFKNVPRTMRCIARACALRQAINLRYAVLALQARYAFCIDIALFLFLSKIIFLTIFFNLLKFLFKKYCIAFFNLITQLQASHRRMQDCNRTAEACRRARRMATCLFFSSFANIRPSILFQNQIANALSK